MSSPFQRISSRSVSALSKSSLVIRHIDQYETYDTAISDFIDNFIEHFYTEHNRATSTNEIMLESLRYYLECYLVSFGERNLVQLVTSYGFDKAIDLVDKADILSNNFIKSLVRAIFLECIDTKKLWVLVREHAH